MERKEFMRGQDTSMKGRVCVVTGANSGIGKATAAELETMGAHVVMVCRDKARGEAALEEIKREDGGAPVDLLIADLSSMESVRRLAGEILMKYPKVHVLINNAGLFNVRRYVTSEGLERTFAVNYLSAFLLTNILLERMKASAPSRIVNVSSVAHYTGHIDLNDLQAERGYSGFKAYSQSKLALVMFTRELALKLSGTGVTVNSLHPGAVATNIWSRPAGPLGFITAVPKLFMASAKKGADTVVYLASSHEVADVTGEYFEKRRIRKSSRESYDGEVARRLWDSSLALVPVQNDAP